MKNSAINTLKYTGTVTLSQCIGSKKIKLAQINNAGGQPLFNFFADCLLSDFEIAKMNCPSKIKLLAEKPGDSEGQTKYESKSGFINWTSKPEKVYTGSVISTVRYSFIVPRALLSGNTFSHIGLYADSAKHGDENNYAAIVFTDSLTDISTSSALIIDWELNISNGIYTDKETK